MADEQAPPSGPDLTLGIELSQFTGETLLGHVGEEDVLLVHSGSDIFAIDAHCSHYHGPLAEGLVVGESVRCPWHHACFDLRTGKQRALRLLIRSRSGRSSRTATASSCGKSVRSRSRAAKRRLSLPAKS